jgi:hypothetical protein
MINYNNKKSSQNLTSNLPTPQNISKWSLGRKECIERNKCLMNQLDSKNTIIKNLTDEIKELKIKITLGKFDFPVEFSESKRVFFDFRFKKNDGDYITYYVTNEELNYDNEIEISISDLVEEFDNSTVSKTELEEYIKDYLIKSISY